MDKLFKNYVIEREREREREQGGNMLKPCTNCKQQKNIPASETLCYTCREREDNMVNQEIINSLKEKFRKAEAEIKDLKKQLQETKRSQSQTNLTSLQEQINTKQTEINSLQQKNSELEKQAQENLTTIQQAQEKITSLKEELQTQKQKHLSYLTSRKSQLLQEITLIKEVLND